MLVSKIKEVLQAVLPITIIVMILHFFFVPLSPKQLALFALGTLMVLVGLAIFLLGVDVSVSQIGHILGQGLVRSKKIWLLIVGSIVIGFIISIAEPSLTILGQQIETMSQGALSQVLVVVVVSVGVAIFMSLGIARIVYQWNISIIVTIFYVLIFLVGINVDESIFTFAFDSSGATTGALTVPFMLAMSSGIASMSNASQAEEFNFGLVGITSIGPIVAMIILGLFFDQQLVGDFPIGDPASDTIVAIIGREFRSSVIQVILGALPLVLIFWFFHHFIEKQSKRVFFDIMKGLLYLMAGLVLFLTGVSSGFMPISQYLGGMLYQSHSPIWIGIIGFTLGVVAILAEPAIYVLIDQIEEITGGTISRSVVLFTIAIGVGLAIVLTIIRIFNPSLRLWHILLVGFMIIIALSWVVPKLFVGMAFDSGGTASGPMTGTFIFAFIQGIAIAHPTADPILDGFGMIAVVAMTPILFVELLGLVNLLASRHQDD